MRARCRGGRIVAPISNDGFDGALMKTRLRPPKQDRCDFIGCLHLLPLCGSPKWSGRFAPALERCLAEAERYADAGVDGFIIENTHDTPYQRVDVDAGTVAGIAICAHEVRRRFDLPVGVQILAGANVAAIDVAATCDLDFVRVEGFVFAHVADEGLIQADAANILRRRAHLRADHIEIWADVQKKHSAHALTADLSLSEHAKAAAYCGADGVVVTGAHTGEPPTPEEVQSVAGHGLRVIVGSGVTTRNIAQLASAADVLVVGSACKKGGHWQGPVDKARVGRLLRTLSNNR